MKTRLLLTALLVCSLSACKAPPPKSLKDIANNVVVKVEGQNSDDLLFVTRNSLVNQFATDAFNIFHDLKQFYQGTLQTHQTVTVQAITDVQNLKGEKFHDKPIFQVTWRVSDIENKLDVKDVGGFTNVILNEASSVQSLNEVGDQVLVKYCMVQEHGKSLKRFCDLVIPGLYSR